MKHSDFVRYIADNLGAEYKNTKLVIETVFRLIEERMISDDNVVISGFGRFDSVDILSRKGVNPQTLEPITIPNLRRAKFVPSKKLKAKLN